MINVLIVDDHALVRCGIRGTLEATDDIRVCGEASSGEQAVALFRDAQNLPIDVVLLDVRAPGGVDGIVITKQLRDLNPTVKIIVVTAYRDLPFPSRVLKAGATGYLTKEASAAELIEAIRSSHAGKSAYMTPELAQQLALHSLEPEDLSVSPFESLSNREHQVMLKVIQGISVIAIAKQLSISTKTVNTYRYRMFDKLQVKNDVALTHLAIRHSLLGASETSVPALLPETEVG